MSDGMSDANSDQEKFVADKLSQTSTSTGKEAIIPPQPTDHYDSQHVGDSIDLIAEARFQADRLEQMNADARAILDRQEAVAVQNTLAGSSVAGVGSPVLSAEDQKKANAKKMLEGTGYDELLFPVEK